MKRAKYGNKKCQYDGLTFDSKHEMQRYRDLYLLQKAGEIKNLRTQVAFMLIPEQRETSHELYKAGPHKGEKKPGKLIERKCEYIADFVYMDKDGNYIVEDAKGMHTKEYLIKRKLMLYMHKIRVVEV